MKLIYNNTNISTSSFRSKHPDNSDGPLFVLYFNTIQWYALTTFQTWTFLFYCTSVHGSKGVQYCKYCKLVYTHNRFLEACLLHSISFNVLHVYRMYNFCISFIAVKCPPYVMSFGNMCTVSFSNTCTVSFSNMWTVICVPYVCRSL